MEEPTIFFDSNLAHITLGLQLVTPVKNVLWSDEAKNAKALYLIKRCLTVSSSALQPWKWQLTGIGYSIVAPIAHATDFGPAVMQPDVLRPSQPRWAFTS